MMLNKKYFLIVIIILLSSCAVRNANSSFYAKVANQANIKYKCEWNASSFNKKEACESWEKVSGYDERLYVFFTKTNGQVYKTVGKTAEDVGVEYIHHKEFSKFKNIKGSHRYCDH